MEARENQLKADEMLARELQEQLYNETPFFANRESVSSLGSRMAEQQEDGQQAAFPIHHGNNAVFPSLQTQPLQQSLRSRLFSRRHRTRHSRPNLSRIRNRSYRSPMAIRNQHYPSMGRHHLFASHMDLDMRMHLLESWEAMYLGDVGVADQFIIDREFGENDYEMLLALDENNHAHHGASVAQIANLPESTVNNDNYETCSICLETPVVGDTMRHLPCLHKFHKDCIDLWLRRKRSCPVCKSDILL